LISQCHVDNCLLLFHVFSIVYGFLILLSCIRFMFSLSLSLICSYSC
jgi:hypothetical protein